MDPCDSYDEGHCNPAKRKRKDHMPHRSHKDIEKRRREKMNGFITHLSQIMPGCNDPVHKVDKLTTLRLAIEYMRTLKGDTVAKTDSTLSHADGGLSTLLNNPDVHSLLLESALSDKFMMVISCDAKLRILHVTKNVQSQLYLAPSVLLGTCFLELLHPSDTSEVKRQLYIHESLQDGNHKKNGLNLDPGSRRSFYCRLKLGCGNKESKFKKGSLEENYQTSEAKTYALVHFSGYFKPWVSDDNDSKDKVMSSDLSYFIAFGTVFTTFAEDADVDRVQRFDSMHSLDGQFISVSESVTYLTGLLPQEFDGKSSYSFYHKEDLADISSCHYDLLNHDYVRTMVYRFKCSEARRYLNVVTSAKVFRNPLTHEPEMLLCCNVLVQCGILRHVSLSKRNKGGKSSKRLRGKEDKKVPEVSGLRMKVESVLCKTFPNADAMKGIGKAPVDYIGSVVLDHFKEVAGSKGQSIDEMIFATVHSPSLSPRSETGESNVSGESLSYVAETQLMTSQELEQKSFVQGHQDFEFGDNIGGLPGSSHLLSLKESLEELCDSTQQAQKYDLTNGGKVIDEDEKNSSGFQITHIKQPQLQIFAADKYKKSLKVPDSSSFNNFFSQVQYATPIAPCLEPLHKHLYSQSNPVNISENELQALRDGVNYGLHAEEYESFAESGLEPLHKDLALFAHGNSISISEDELQDLRDGISSAPSAQDRESFLVENPGFDRSRVMSGLEPLHKDLALFADSNSFCISKEELQNHDDLTSAPNAQAKESFTDESLLCAGFDRSPVISRPEPLHKYLNLFSQSNSVSASEQELEKRLQFRDDVASASSVQCSEKMMNGNSLYTGLDGTSTMSVLEPLHRPLPAWFSKVDTIRIPEKELQNNQSAEELEGETLGKDPKNERANNLPPNQLCEISSTLSEANAASGHKQSGNESNDEHSLIPEGALNNNDVQTTNVCDPCNPVGDVSKLPILEQLRAQLLQHSAQIGDGLLFSNVIQPLKRHSFRGDTETGMCSTAHMIMQDLYSGCPTPLHLADGQTPKLVTDVTLDHVLENNLIPETAVESTSSEAFPVLGKEGSVTGVSQSSNSLAETDQFQKILDFLTRD